MALSIIICSVPGFASAAEKSTEQKATDLNNMGLYAGTDPNKFTPDLNASLTREQGIALAIRLMGLEEDALAMTDADVAAALSAFSDSSGVSGWAVKYVAFAVKNSLINDAVHYAVQESNGIADLAHFERFPTIGYGFHDFMSGTGHKQSQYQLGYAWIFPGQAKMAGAQIPKRIHQIIPG